MDFDHVETNCKFLKDFGAIIRLKHISMLLPSFLFEDVYKCIRIKIALKYSQLIKWLSEFKETVSTCC